MALSLSTEATIPLTGSINDWLTIDKTFDPDIPDNSTTQTAIEILDSYTESDDEFWRFQDLLKGKTIKPIVQYCSENKCQRVLKKIFAAAQKEFETPASFSINSLLLLRDIMQALDLRNSEIPINPNMLSILKYPANNPTLEETRLAILNTLKENDCVIIAVHDQEFCYTMDDLLKKTDFFHRMISTGTKEVSHKSEEYAGLPRITLSTVENLGIEEKHWIVILKYLNDQEVDISEMIEEIGVKNCQDFFDFLGLNSSAQDILKSNSTIYKSILKSYKNMQEFHTNWIKYRSLFTLAFIPVVIFRQKEAQAEAMNFTETEDLIDFNDFVKRIQNQYVMKEILITKRKMIIFNHQAEESTIRALGPFQKIKHMIFSNVPSTSLLRKLQQWKIERLFSFDLQDLSEEQASHLKSLKITIDSLTIEHLSQPKSLSLLSSVNNLELLEITVTDDQVLHLEAKQSVKCRSSSVKKLHITADSSAVVYQSLSLQELTIEAKRVEVLNNPSLKIVKAPKATYIDVNLYKNLDLVEHPETARFKYTS